MGQINIPYKLQLLNSNLELINELSLLLQEEKFTKVAIITSKTPNQILTNEIEINLFNKLEKLKTFQVIDASIAYVNQLQLNDFHVVIGVGGGKVIDVAKYAAHLNNLPSISIPTSISNDGICSPISVLKEKGNKHKSYGAKIPFAMFVPIHLVEASNDESLTSGIGDLISNISAIEDWKLAHKENGEAVDDYAIIVSENAANVILLEIEKYILLRKSKKQFLKDNLDKIIYSLALSGIAMEIAGTSRPSSGAEHLISHSIDELFGGVRQHGIQVAFGMYVIYFLKSKLGLISKEKLEELRAVFRFIGLPVTLSSMNLSKDQLIQAILHAPETRPDRYTFLNKLNLNKNKLDLLLESFAEVELKTKIKM